MQHFSIQNLEPAEDDFPAQRLQDGPQENPLSSSGQCSVTSTSTITTTITSTSTSRSTCARWASRKLFQFKWSVFNHPILLRFRLCESVKVQVQVQVVSVQSSKMFSFCLKLLLLLDFSLFSFPLRGKCTLSLFSGRWLYF